jgi:hypothetical protein
MISTTQDRPAARRTADPAARLRSSMAAVRVSLSGLGTHKTLTPEQKSEAADPFDASGQFLAASKNCSIPNIGLRAYRRPGPIIQYWKGNAPYSRGRA